MVEGVYDPQNGVKEPTSGCAIDVSRLRGISLY